MAVGLQTLSRIEGGTKRAAEIIGVLAKYGLADWLEGVDIDWIQNRLKSEAGEQLRLRTTNERIRLALTELGTSFIKLGQMLSTRPDLIGPALSQELTLLQSKAPADEPSAVVETIRDELGQDPSELFSSFADEPLASASIGQVHEAKLETGERVVVKVAHEGIEQRVRRDLDIMLTLAEFMEKRSPALRQYQPLATAKQFERTLLREMDFGYEARHLKLFAQNFEGDATVHIPRPHLERCSRRVLTMEYLDGIAVSDRDKLALSGEDLEEFARRGANMYLEMIFRDGFYHADPHPGNLLLLPGNVVGVLDAGMVGRLDEGLREEIERLLLAAVEPDPREMVDVLCRIGQVPPELDREELSSELGDLLADYGHVAIDQFDLGGALTRVADLVRGYHLVMPGGFALLLKTLIMLEGTAQQVSPRFALAELLRPYYRRAMQRRLAPGRIIKELGRAYRDWHRLLKALPRDASDIIGRVRQGSFEVHLEHRHLEGTVDRLVQGILLAALFMGSSMIVATAVPPVLWGVSVFGALGCAVASVLGFGLLRAIRKSDKQRRK